MFVLVPPLADRINEISLFARSIKRFTLHLYYLFRISLPGPNSCLKVMLSRKRRHVSYTTRWQLNCEYLKHGEQCECEMCIHLSRYSSINSARRAVIAGELQKHFGEQYQVIKCEQVPTWICLCRNWCYTCVFLPACIAQTQYISTIPLDYGVMQKRNKLDNWH